MPFMFIRYQRGVEALNRQFCHYEGRDDNILYDTIIIVANYIDYFPLYVHIIVYCFNYYNKQFCRQAIGIAYLAASFMQLFVYWVLNITAEPETSVHNDFWLCVDDDNIRLSPAFAFNVSHAGVMMVHFWAFMFLNEHERSKRFNWALFVLVTLYPILTVMSALVLHYNTALEVLLGFVIGVTSDLSFIYAYATKLEPWILHGRGAISRQMLDVFMDFDFSETMRDQKSQIDELPYTLDKLLEPFDQVIILRQAHPNILDAYVIFLRTASECLMEYSSNGITKDLERRVHVCDKVENALIRAQEEIAKDDDQSQSREIDKFGDFGSHQYHY